MTAIAAVTTYKQVWKVPSGSAPYPTVPRFSVPCPKKGTKNSIEYVRFLSDNKAALSAVIRTKLTDHQLTQANSSQKRFFFVDKQFPQLHGNIDPAHKSLKDVVDDFSRPSKSVIKALYEREPISLPDVMKLALAFACAIALKHHGAMAYFGLQGGNPLDDVSSRPIVPAFRLADPTKIKPIVKGLRASEDGFNRYLRPHSLAVGSGFFAAHLERGHTAGNGGRTGGYLLTEQTATLLHGYLNSIGQVDPLSTLFPDDPGVFPGNGLYCAPLARRHGNFA